MSFTEVLAELPALTVAERQAVIRHALELDDPQLTAEEQALIKQRLTDHRRNPASAVGLDDMKKRLRSHRS